MVEIKQIKVLGNPSAFFTPVLTIDNITGHAKWTEGAVDSNFAYHNLIASGDRLHNFNSHVLDIENLAGLSLKTLAGTRQSELQLATENGFYFRNSNVATGDFDELVFLNKGPALHKQNGVFNSFITAGSNGVVWLESQQNGVGSSLAVGVQTVSVTPGTNQNGMFLVNTNNACRLARGTTAERPSSPAEGDERYNLTDHKKEYYNGSVWIQT